LFGNINTELLIPLIDKEGLGAFSLQVIVVPFSYPKFSHCFLEQYYLLNKSFNLNTYKVVNFRVNQGFKIFLYDLDCKILYYSSISALFVQIWVYTALLIKNVYQGRVVPPS
jgi:hypothetical protein